MEKRRRARINHCLNELKSLILEAMKKDVSILYKKTLQFLFHTQKNWQTFIVSAHKRQAVKIKVMVIFVFKRPTNKQNQTCLRNPTVFWKSC